MNTQDKTKDELINELLTLQDAYDSLKKSFENKIKENLNTEKTLKETAGQFQSLYSNSSIGLYRTTPAGQIIAANPAIIKMMGYDSFEEISKRDLSKTGYPDIAQREKFKELIEQYDEITNFETEWMRKDGTIIYVSEGSKAVRDELGKIIFYDGTVENITERKNAEEAMRLSEAKFRAVVEHSNDGILFGDANAKILYRSPSYNKLNGYMDDERIGRSGFETVHPDNLDLVKQFWSKVIEQPEMAHKIEYQIKHKDGSWRWIETSGQNLLNIPDLHSVVVTSRDITDRKIAEHDLILAKENAEESEKKLKTIFEYSLDALRISKKGITFFFNQAYMKLFGYDDRNEMIGKSVLDHMPVREHERIRNYMQKRTNGEEVPCFYEGIGIRKNGEEFPFEVKVGQYTLDNEKYSLAILRDISERKQTEALVRRNHQFTEALLKSIPTPVFFKDIEGKYLGCNDAFSEQMGVTSDEIKGKTVKELWPSELAEVYHEKDLQLLETGQHQIYEHKVKDKNGKLHDVIYAKDVFYDEDGKPAGIIGAYIDISEHKRAERELIVAKEKAEESDRLKSSFLQNMSHEVRTPLNAIVGFSELMVYSANKPQKLKEYADAISTSSDNLIEIITDLIEISEISAKSFKAVHTDFNLVTFIKNLTGNFEGDAKHKNIVFELNMNLPAQEYFINSDIEKLKKIISHLIDNAIKFTHTGKIEIHVKIINDNLQITINDTGIGIAGEMQKVIFEPFRQLDTGSSRKFGGNGLGLSIVKAYVELLCGTITLKSELNIGTSICVNIPFNKSSKHVSKKTNIEQKQFVNTILIAEDDISNFKYLRDLLDESNTNILHVVNGKQALDMCIDNDEIDLVLMDIEMPVMDGHTATKLIKEIRPNLPIIAQTAYALDSEKEKYQDAFDDYITKPIRRAVLQDKLKKYITPIN